MQIINLDRHYCPNRMSSQSAIIMMRADLRDNVKVKFDFPAKSTKSGNYTLDLVQRDIAGNIVGGETFEIIRRVKNGTVVGPIIDVDPIPAIPPQYNLSVNNPEYSDMKWFNNIGETIGSGNSIEVYPEYNKSEYTVQAIVQDDELVFSSVDLHDFYGIKSIVKSQDAFEIYFCDRVPENAVISLVSTLNGKDIMSKDVENGSQSISIEIAGIKSCVYIIRYEADNRILDVKNIVIN